MGFFSFPRCVEVAQIVSGYLSEGIAPYVAVDLVFPRGEVSSGVSYVTFLNQNLLNEVTKAPDD